MSIKSRSQSVAPNSNTHDEIVKNKVFGQKYFCPLIPLLENNLQSMDNKVNKKLDKVLKNRNRNNSIAEKAR